MKGGVLPGPRLRPDFDLAAWDAILERPEFNRMSAKPLVIDSDSMCQYIRVRQIVQIGQAIILEPENIQTGFVSGS